MRTPFIFAVVALVAFVASPAAAIPAHLVPTFSENQEPERGYLPKVGDLVKLVDDGDPTTTGDDAVYYIDADLKRRAFPNHHVFMTWFRDFSEVQEVTKEELASIRLIGNIRFRPGAKLIKVPSVPKVYAVEPGGVLRWIGDEEIAIALYGPDWADRVRDVPESLFIDYEEGAPITAPRWPTGTFVRRAADTALFYIDGDRKRYVRPSVVADLRMAEEDVAAETGGALSAYRDGATFEVADIRLTDAGESFRIETLPPPMFDHPEPLDATADAGEEGAALYRFRLTTGALAAFRGIAFDLSASSGAPGALLSDLRIEDEEGNRPFGTIQLPDGATRAAFSGAEVFGEDEERSYVLRADVSADAPSGATVNVALHRDALDVHDVYGAIPTVWPIDAWPEGTLTIR